MRRNKILYSLNAQDFQTVAEEQIGRPLTNDELTRLSNLVAERIPWYDLVCEGLNELQIKEFDSK